MRIADAVLSMVAMICSPVGFHYSAEHILGTLKPASDSDSPFSSRQDRPKRLANRFSNSYSGKNLWVGRIMKPYGIIPASPGVRQSWAIAVGRYPPPA